MTECQMKRKIRNHMFHQLRRWAYSKIRLYHDKDYDSFESACRKYADKLNKGSYESSLSAKERREVTSRVASWTWANLTKDKAAQNKMDWIQSCREKGLDTRRANRAKRKEEFAGIYNPNGPITIAQASKAVGISESTGKAFWAEIKKERDSLAVSSETVS